MKKVLNQALIVLLFSTLLSSIELLAQSRRPADPEAYGSRFFEQLQLIFGRFRDSDLKRAFEEAQPIQCSELVGRKGEWRQVAFFNEDRSLGDWFRKSIGQVRSDLAVYTFKGSCGGGALDVGSEFPTDSAIQDYNQGRISLDQVDITVNEPVKAVLDPKSKTYTFDLPYLFLKEDGPRRIYSLIAPNRNSVYATDVASRWECKAVSSKDVTYRFLICRVGTIPLGRLPRGETFERTFGSSAYFILSDGTEAQTHVNLTFGKEVTTGEDVPVDDSSQTDTAKPEESTPRSVPRPVLKRDK